MGNDMATISTRTLNPVKSQFVRSIARSTAVLFRAGREFAAAPERVYFLFDCLNAFIRQVIYFS
jgi:hypothetical protein